MFLKLLSFNTFKKNICCSCLTDVAIKTVTIKAGVSLILTHLHAASIAGFLLWVSEKNGSIFLGEKNV